MGPWAHAQNEPTFTCGAVILLESNTVMPWARVEGELAFQTDSGKLVVEGHPLRPNIKLIGFDETSQDCAVKGGDLSSFYRRLVDDPGVSSALANWDAWRAQRDEACSSRVDSAVYVQPGAGRKVALVLHGVFSNPEAMRPIVLLLLDAGFNVVAPRLSGHFNKDIRDIADARFAAWRNDAEEVYALTKEFSAQKMLIAGYSLGGLLASDIALKHPEDVERLLLLSPAWRASNLVNLGASFGDLFGITLNDIHGEPASCKTGNGFAPASAGKQVQELASVMQQESKRPGYSAFSFIKPPILVLMGSRDDMMLGGVDSNLITRICEGLPTCQYKTLQNVDHVGMVKAITVGVPAVAAGPGTGSLILRFVSQPWSN